MLHDVLKVRDEVVRRCQGREIDLETVAGVIEETTLIDELVYVEVDVSFDNPIIGRFRRFNRFPSVYAGSGTFAEVEYAKHLSEEWRRFVVVKEACHALAATEGVHMVADSALANLVVQFSVKSQAGTVNTDDLVVELEVLAEIGAIEILCPINERKKILGTTASPNLNDMMKRFKIPRQPVARAFSPGYINLVQVLLDNNN